MNILYLIGKSFFYYWFILLSVTTIGFIIGVGISVNYSYISIAILFLLLLLSQKNYIYSLKIITGLALLVFISILISLQFWDFSYDGRAYHFTAVQALSEGWNPFYCPNLGLFKEYQNSVWIESYPKSNWIFLANNFQLFHNIDAAKFVNYTLAISTGFILNSFLLIAIKNVVIRVFFVFTVILNPVVWGQINTLYLDGNVYFLTLLLIVSLVEYYYNRNRENFLFLAIISIILINMKFTALVFVFIAYFLFFLFDLIASKKLNLKTLKRGSIILLLGIAVYGYSPYITNMHFNGHPLHPVLGKDKKDVIQTQMNNEFLEKNRFQKFFYSIGSVPTDERRSFPELSNPLKTSFYLDNYLKNSPDLRINGFGPLYSISIILIIFGIFYSVYRRYAINKFFIMAILLTLMAFAIPTTWWARLVPVLWAVPIFFSIYFYTTRDYALKLLSLFIVIILFINATIMGGVTVAKSYIYTKKAYQELNAISNKHIYIAFRDGHARAGKKSIIHKLKIYDIDYTILSKNKCKLSAKFYNADICKMRHIYK